MPEQMMPLILLATSPLLLLFPCDVSPSMNALEMRNESEVDLALTVLTGVKAITRERRAEGRNYQPSPIQDPALSQAAHPELVSVLCTSHGRELHLLPR